MKRFYLRLMGIISSLAPDKVMHCLVSMVICIVIAAVLARCGVSHDPVIYISLFLTLLIGGLKEVADKAWGGNASFQDFLADFIGVTLAMLLISILIV